MNTEDMDKLHDELIAYLEGELSPEARLRVDQKLIADNTYRAEMDWLRTAYAEMDVAARPASADLPAPEIDIVDSVMRAVDKVNGTAKTVSLNEARQQRQSRRYWIPAAAIAAAVLACVGYVVWDGQRPTKDDSGNTIAVVTPQPKPDSSDLESPAPNKLPGMLAERKEKLDQLRGDVQKRTGIGPDMMVATAGPQLVLPGNSAEVVAARREISGGATMDKLLQWASLSKGKAMEVALSPDASPQAMVGAASDLGGEEARRILLTAVGKLPEDPSSRVQLARLYEEEPADDPAVAAQNDALAVAQLSDVKNIDPGNALPYYYEAKIRLDENNPELALQSLEAAKGLGKVSAYSLEAALANAEALIAGGMDADAARMVSALTAGVEENKFLCQLASDLLDYGQGFLSANDTETAENIFRAVESLGRQVEEGASFSQEQLAGMDIQAQALD
ncbi:MAG TPA: hypothetical protein PK869_06515, partial [Candidatus Hydrogenedentes bacterium]|nr:hypothetical protein [Candidatus Hydrogenedentota bacterium]